MARARSDAKPAVELLEEAVTLLRSNGLAVLWRYYFGAVPFVLGLLFFWADMSRSAYARSRLAGSSLLMALLFLWMKSWQASFGHELRRRLTAGGAAPVREPLAMRDLARLIIVQGVLQPAGFVLLPLASVALVPLPWCYAFFQNIGGLPPAEHDWLRGTFARAARQAALWPRQNVLLTILLALFAVVVFFDWAVLLFTLPIFARMLFGIESVFTRTPLAMLNSTFFAVALGLTYLSLDPLAKAAYVLRTFWGESRTTGEAWRAELARLRRMARRGGALAALAFGLALALAPRVARAQTPAEGAPAVSPAELDREIKRTLREPRYAWRMPRERAAAKSDEDKSVLEMFMEGVSQQMEGVSEWIGKKWRAFTDWWDRRQHDRRTIRRSSSRERNWGEAISLTHALLIILSVVIVGGLIGLLIHWMMSRRRPVLAAAPVAEPVAPDLRDENVLADELPVDRWLALAQELIAKGDGRLAMRALFLAMLAALADRDLVRVRRSKSNLDYLRELGRRAHALPRLLGDFRAGVRAFEDVWYGMHAVERGMLDEAVARYERIRADVG